MGSRGRDTAGRVRIGCTRASQSGDCPDPRSYYADTIEEHVLERLSLELAAPNQLNAFTEAYREEMRRLQEHGSTEREQVEKRLARVSAEIDRYTRYLGQGVGDVARLDAEIKSRMPEEQELKARLAQMDAPQAVIALHPAALDAHARAIQQLRGSLENGDSDAAKLIRQVVHGVVLHPQGEVLSRRDSPKPMIEIIGALDALLQNCRPISIRGQNGSGGGT